MSVTSFRVENEKAIRLAECEAVPPVMIIAGPNGVGKSTLLYALHRRIGLVQEGDTQIIYQPPHRAIRRQQVQRRFLSQDGARRLSDTFSSEAINAFEGLSIPFPSRAPDNVDEAGSTLKFTLGRLENRRQAVLAALVDQRGSEGRPLETDSLPHVFEPIARLTSRLLPHLRFERIDFSNENNIKCVFTRTDVLQEDTLDLDDLSSGEKSIFILFLPLIEADINARLNQLDPQDEEDQNALRDQLILIDETEQHLHPELQARLLGYLREEAARSNTQFIVTTHSPTLVDQAFDDELYLLNFVVGEGQNQLRRIASTPERLETLRALAGTTFVVTTGRTIVAIEGAADTAGGTSDLRLLETLHPAATRYTFVPVGGKGNVIRVVEGLRAEVAEANLGIRVAGLVDRDRTVPSLQGVVSWPVCMIENLLLDPAAIAAVASEAAGLEITPTFVEEGLNQQAIDERHDEISLRVARSLGAKTIRPKGASAEEVAASLEEAIAALQFAESKVAEAISEAEREVDQAIADGTYLEVFRGKQLLRGIYRRLGLARCQLSFEQFAYSIAQRLAELGTLAETIDAVFREIGEADAQIHAPETGSPVSADAV